LRVDALKYALDRAVLAAGVHRLQHDQQAAFLLPVQARLQVTDPVPLPLQLVSDVLLAPVVLGLVRVHLREPHRVARLDPIPGVVGLRWRLLHYMPLRMRDVDSLCCPFGGGSLRWTPSPGL
jgi:hypothetical protein